MKKIFIAFAAIAFLASCGNTEQKPADSTTTAPASDAKTTDLSSNPDYKKGLALIGQNDCFGCHKLNEVYTGPAYVDVAKKYAGQSGAIEDTLAQRIIKGHTGVWGSAYMTPHPALSADDAKAMVRYVLLLNQQ